MEKDLEYYKKQSEKEYSKTPDSVIEYINKLEDELKGDNFINDIPFLSWWSSLDMYQQSIVCHENGIEYPDMGSIKHMYLYSSSSRGRNN